MLGHLVSRACALGVSSLGALLASGLLLCSGTAEAAPHDGDCRPARVARDHCATSRSRDCPCASDPYPYSVRTDVRVRGGGSSWSVLRRYLPDNGAYIRQQYVKRYFLRRWPHVLTEGKEQETLEELLRERRPDERLSTEQTLALGMVRFHAGGYADAQTEFQQVLMARPRESRAQLGLAFCALMRHDWSGAAGSLEKLDELGELRGDDRLEDEGTFADTRAWERLRSSLTGYLGYRFTDTSAQLCAAWCALLVGEHRVARAHLAEARQWGHESPLLSSLERVLLPVDAQGEKPPPAPAEAAPAETPASIPEQAPRAPLRSAIIAIGGAAAAAGD